MENRHYCTYCGRKKNESKMILLWYPLIKKITHIISSSSRSDKKEISKKMRSTTPLQMIEFFIEVMIIINKNYSEKPKKNL